MTTLAPSSPLTVGAPVTVRVRFKPVIGFFPKDEVLLAWLVRSAGEQFSVERVTRDAFASTVQAVLIPSGAGWDAQGVGEMVKYAFAMGGGTDPSDWETVSVTQGNTAQTVYDLPGQAVEGAKGTVNLALIVAGIVALYLLSQQGGSRRG